MYAAGVLVDNESAIHNQQVWENNAYINYTGAVSILNEFINDYTGLGIKISFEIIRISNRIILR